MKRGLFSILCVTIACINCNGVTINTQPNNLIQPNFKLNFDNISDLAKSNLLSDLLKGLVADCLDIIRILTKNNAILGNADDIQAARAYAVQLTTLEKRLSEADTTEKILNIQEIGEAGKEAIKQIKKIVTQLQMADSAQKLTEVEGINQYVVELIKRYNNLMEVIASLKTMSDALKIPYVSEEFLENTKKDLGLLAQLGTIDSISKLKKFKNANPNLISEIEELEKVTDYIKNHTESMDGILKIPGLANKGIVEISRMQKDLEVSLEQNNSLQKNIEVAQRKIKEAEATTRNEYHFRMIVISLILRITFGFEFALANDFKASAKEYELSTVNHANALLPYSAGVSKKLWQNAASHLGAMLQLVLSVEDIENYIDILKKHMDEVKASIKTMNDTKSKFIFDALDQLADILRRFSKDRDSMSFGDFNSRKNMVLDRLKQEKQELNFEKQIKKDSKAATADNATASKALKKDSDEKNKKTETKEKKKKSFLSIFE